MSADLDQAIDRAVRELLDVEGPAGLRGRVMQRIEGPVGSWLASVGASVASTFRWKTWLLPVTAAAVIVFGVLVPWRTERPAEGPVVGVATDRPLERPAAARTAGAPETPQAPLPTMIAQARRRAPRADRRVEAAVTADVEGATVIDPLATIAPIVAAGTHPAYIAPKDIVISPMAPIAPLQIAPLSPPERRN